MENNPKRCEAPKTGTPPIEISLCELSQPWMWIPESYSELVCTPGRFLMKFTGSVFPRIFGSDCIMSTSIFVTPCKVSCIAEECFSVTNVVLSRCRYKESVCASASDADIAVRTRNANSMKCLCLDLWCKMLLHYFSARGNRLKLFCKRKTEHFAETVTEVIDAVYEVSESFFWDSCFL